MQRFELKQEPEGSWAVIDSLKGLPIEAEGKQLKGLDLEEAQQALFIANTGILRDIANRRHGWRSA